MSVYNIGWMKRKLASAIFATPPESSLEEALKWFEQAEEVKPGFWKINRVKLAEVYIAMGETLLAREWLDKALAMPSNTLDDKNAQTEAEALDVKC